MTTEVTSRILETENRLVFVVDPEANKADIKRAVEELYGVKVTGVNVAVTHRGKKAFVRLHPDYKASDVAIRLGML